MIRCPGMDCFEDIQPGGGSWSLSLSKDQIQFVCMTRLAVRLGLSLAPMSLGTDWSGSLVQQPAWEWGATFIFMTIGAITLTSIQYDFWKWQAMPDIFEGATDQVVEQRLRFQVILFLQGARRRLRWSRMRMKKAALTATEVTVLSLIVKEAGEILNQGQTCPE